MSVNQTDRARLIAIMRVKSIEGFTKAQLDSIEKFKKALKPKINKLRRLVESLSNYNNPLHLNYYIGYRTAYAGKLEFHCGVEISDTEFKEIFGDYAVLIESRGMLDEFKYIYSLWCYEGSESIDVDHEMKQLDRLIETAELLASVIKSCYN